MAQRVSRSIDMSLLNHISVSLKGFAAFATLTIIATAACGLIYMRSTSTSRTSGSSRPSRDTATEGRWSLLYATSCSES